MTQARTEFAAALNQIASEKGVDPAIVLDAIKQAALAAYKKDLVLRNEPVPEDFEEFTSEVNSVTGEISIFDDKKNVTPPGFARIAASIARQVIMQRLNEAEKGAIMSEYENKVGTVISGLIQRQEGNTYFIDLGRAEGVMPPSEQVRLETYILNQRLKFFIKEIRESSRGPEVVVSRADPALVKGLFAMEVPEIQSGAVEIKAIAREAGGRTKLAAVSSQEGVDPVGSLVGQKGVRVQAVMQELGEEKIDIITFSEDPARFIASALSPAKEAQVKLNEEEKVATVTVPSLQLSLAIGKGGQNVRLAAKLTGWKIDIVGAEESEEERLEVGDEKEKTKGNTSEVKDENKVEKNTSEVSEKEAGTHEKEKQVDEGGKVQAAPADDSAKVKDKKEKAKEAIEEEVKEAEEKATTTEDKKEAEKAGEVLEKAVEEENPEAEKAKLEEVIGETAEPEKAPESDDKSK